VPTESKPRSYRLGKRANSVASTRSRILEAGWDQIEAAGYRPVSVDVIARAANVTRVTVYRHFATRGALLAAIAWDRLARANLDRLDAARARPDVVDATREFLAENCRLMSEVGGILRTMLALESEEPELGEILDLTYRGRRFESISQLADRILDSDRRAEDWTKEQLTDALGVLTSVETFTQVARDNDHRIAATTLIRLSDALFSNEATAQANKRLV